MRPVRSVVHLVPLLFGEQGCYGGAERYALELARAMSGKVDTTLVTFGSRPRQWREGALRLRVVRNWTPVRRLRFDPVNPLVVQALQGADVIHYHQSKTMMAALALAFGAVRRVPVFSTDHGGSGWGLHRVIDTDPLYAGHLHVSQFSREVLGSARQRARVIYGGVDTGRFSPDPQQARTGEILYAGRLLPHKGVDSLLEAADPQMQVRVLGRPFAHAERFAALLRTMAVGKQVTFEADADDARLVAAYRGALCVVLPSVHRTVYGEHYRVPELLGQTLLEAMACGTPVVATAVASLPEVVEDGVTGFVVPPNDPAALRSRLRWLLENPARVEQMGAAARQRVLRQFTWDRVVEACLAEYAMAPEGGC